MPATEALDVIARGLAQGMSRREALRRGGAAFVAAVALTPGDAWAKATRRCPGHRVKCNGKCCQTGEVCLHPKGRAKHGKKPKPKCGCPAHTTRCKGKCAHTRTDVHNCGRCGHTCGRGQNCTNGKCTCPAHQVQCGGNCVSVSSDHSNCGACGHGCATGAVCAHGVCAAGCPAGTVNCSGGCVSTTSDPLNCGACGHTCAAGLACSAGACVAICPSGTVNCSGGCVKTATDAHNCGTCGKVCASGLVCIAGACATCPSGTTNCGGTCVNTASDPSNCGACGTACGASQFCNTGVCANCPTGDVSCSGVCCAGTACCAGGCQTVHDNGVGGSYYDCGALGVPGSASTYSLAMAREAAAAFSPQTPILTTCGGAGKTYDVLIASDVNQQKYATWAYDGAFAGHVRASDFASQCPDGSSPTWN